MADNSFYFVTKADNDLQPDFINFNQQAFMCFIINGLFEMVLCLCL